MKVIDFKDDNEQKSQQFTNEKKIIRKLIDKWICNHLLFEFTFNPRITKKLEK